MSHVITQNIKEMCIQGLKFNINDIYRFIKDIHKWVWLLRTLPECASEE